MCPICVPTLGMTSPKDAVAAALAAAKSRSHRASALSATSPSPPNALAKPGSKSLARGHGQGLGEPHFFWNAHLVSSWDHNAAAIEYVRNQLRTP